jgi:superfamily II DNA or RNA helicase/predicted house-cleaning noncanonical NTP pyrophosphatase (MazG superfamily)
MNRKKPDTIWYDKLVRDRIPEIITESGKVPHYHAVGDAELAYHLKSKLIEECHELFRARTGEDYLKESADILEILRALSAALELRWDDVERCAEQRRLDRGGFDNRYFLRAVSGVDVIEDESPPQARLPQLISRHSPYSLIDIIGYELLDAAELHMASAFCTRGMLNLLLKHLLRFSDRGGRIRLLTSVMDNFNNPDDLELLCDHLPNLELRIFYPPSIGSERDFTVPPPPFHLKCFLFEKPDQRCSLIIGSSNLTGGGLARNYEWNYFSNSEVNVPLDNRESPYAKARRELDRYWNEESIPLNEEFLETYRPWWERSRVLRRQASESITRLLDHKPYPRPAQREALKRLSEKRALGIEKAAVIAATGLGKTFLSAFDFAAGGFRNVLFIAHRETILRKARDSYRRVLGKPEFGILLSGGQSSDSLDKAQKQGTSCFAMIQTLSRKDVYRTFHRDFFDYIVIDEFHHSEAKSYRRVLEWFRPRFLLGMTATPERMDGRDVLRHCDYEVAYESRLFDAIEKRWLVPFQYFAIYDPSDYTSIRWTGTGYDEEELEDLLSDDTRAQLVVRNLKLFYPSTGKIKALAFCSSKNHARFMSCAFNRLGLPSLCLLGEDAAEAREKAVKRLQDEADELQVICSVDVFGEGVDIPSVSHVLFLRPTQSFTVFLQQLGRGLRTAPEKEYLVALDFVGNFRNSYVAPLAIRGFHSAQEYLEATKQQRDRKPPTGCYVSPDVEVQNIWNKELRRIFRTQGRREMLVQLYRELRSNMGRSPQIMDFFANPEAQDPYAFIKFFDGWLRTKKHMNDLTPFEEQLIGTPGEQFLVHIQKELRSVRSYKMVVLRHLLSTPQGSSQWTTGDIAKGFKQYFLDHREHLGDYAEMNRAKDPQEFPLARVEQKLRQMPLKYLSNSTEDFFVFDRDEDVLRLKAPVMPYWQQAEFRALVADRVEFALKRYLYRRNHPK